MQQFGFIYRILMENTHYERLGGEKSVRELVDRFYDLMDSRTDTN